MEIFAHDTLTATRTVLGVPAAERPETFRRELAAPFGRLLGTLGVPVAEDDFDPTMAARFLGCVRPDDDPVPNLAALERLEREDAWPIAAAALRRSVAAFAGSAAPFPERVELALMLADRHNRELMEFGGGTGGFGGIPGWVVVDVWPTGDALERLPAAVSHEFHHNARLSFEPWRMDVSLGEYVVLEGMAEAFAAELWGEERVGPWATSLTGAELARATAAIGGALDVRGFAEVRAYMFGDPLASTHGYEPVGVGYGAGYAVGYRLVRDWLARTGVSVVEATTTPSAEILAGSAAFFGMSGDD